MIPLFFLLCSVSFTILVDPKTYPIALRLLHKATQASDSNLSVSLNLSLQYISWSNNTCLACSKTFRNDSFLGFHWLSKHYKDQSDIHIVLKHFCQFASCRGNKPLPIESRMHLCMRFTEKYLEDIKSLNNMTILRKRDRFCRAVLVSNQESQDYLLEPLIKIGYVIVLMALIAGLWRYYVSLYEKFTSQTKRKSKRQ